MKLPAQVHTELACCQGSFETLHQSQTEMKVKNRYVAPDFMRGVAIILMIYGHITYVGSSASIQKHINEFIYTFHMPLFLIISGFFFKLNDDILYTWNKIYRKIIIPYVFFLSLYLFGIVLINRIGINTSNRAISSMLEYIETVFVDPYGAYWFLHAIIVFQLCFLLSDIFSKILLANKFTLYFFSTFLIYLNIRIGVVEMHNSIYFLAGFLMKDISKKFPNNFFLSIVVIFFILIFDVDGIYKFSLTNFIWCFGILSLFSQVEYMVKFRTFVSVLSWFGRNTLVILLLHSFFIVVMKPISIFFVKIDHTGIIFSFIATILSLFGCILSAFLFDKLNISRFLFGVDNIYSRYIHLRRS